MFRPKINDVNIYVPFCQTNGIWRRFQKPTTPKPTQKPILDMGLIIPINMKELKAPSNATA